MKLKYLLSISLFALLLSGCLPTEADEDENSTSSNTEVPVEGQVIVAEIEHENSDTGISFIVSDTDNSEAIGFQTNYNADGSIKNVSSVYYTNDANNDVSIDFDVNNLPIRITYTNGLSIYLSNHTMTSVDMAFYMNGTLTDNLSNVAMDMSQFYAVSSEIAQANAMSRGLNLQAACSWFPGGCKNMYWWGSLGLGVLGCGTAVTAAGGTTVISAGTLSTLAVPAAIATCSSVLVTTVNDIVKDNSDEKIFVATGMLSGGVLTAKDCITSGFGVLSNPIDCVKGVGDFIYNVVDEAKKNDGQADDTSTTFDDACLSGTWKVSTLKCSQLGQSFDLPSSEIVTMSQHGTSVSLTGNSVSVGVQPQTSTVSYDWDGSTLSGGTSLTFDNPNPNGSSSKCSIVQNDTWKISNCKNATIEIKIQQYCEQSSTLTCTGTSFKR